jgi:hypothetical protein
MFRMMDLDQQCASERATELATRCAPREFDLTTTEGRREYHDHCRRTAAQIAAKWRRTHPEETTDG